MSSHDKLALEQRARALQMKEQALDQRAQQQASIEQRIKAHQDALAETERANQLKIQDLIKREQKLEEEKRMIKRETQALYHTHQKTGIYRRRRAGYLFSVLMLACVAAGYLAFDYLQRESQYARQVTAASDNISKLANALNMTQEEVLMTSGMPANKQEELDKTRNMLTDLKYTTDRLQLEIMQLRNSQGDKTTDRAALSSSARTLAEQLNSLYEQLEDHYLTMDVNEAYIDFQSSDLEDLENRIQAQENLISMQKKRIEAYEQRVAELRHNPD